MRHLILIGFVVLVFARSNSFAGGEGNGGDGEGEHNLSPQEKTGTCFHLPSGIHVCQ
jgi:hypothetical protein